MAAQFATWTDKDEKFYFNLKAGNGEVILASQGYSAMESCANGIESVRRNCADDSRFARETASDSRYYFNLTATNGPVIGKSQMYQTESGRDGGIESVRKNAPDAVVVEQKD